MGGINEKVVTPPAAGKSVSTGTVSSFRIHENHGEVHLHDDAKNQKFVCSVAEFYSWWKEGKIRCFSPTLLMTGNDGQGNAIIAKFDKILIDGVIDIGMTFEPVKFGDSVKLIDAFVTGI